MDDIKALAYHETGHAIVSILVGVPFKHVTIIANEEMLGHIKPNSVFSLAVGLNVGNQNEQASDTATRMAMMMWGGDVAEEIYLGHRPKDRSWTDLRDIAEIASKRSEQPAIWAKDLRREVKQKLQDTWAYVELIATALLEKQTLTSKEVCELLEIDYPWDWIDTFEANEFREWIAKVQAEAAKEEEEQS